MSRTAAENGVAPEIRARYEPVIGLEVHCQLATRTKVFCACSTRFGDAPNANTCPVCLGLPGSLPVLNKGALELAIRAALALNCTVQERSRFARKNYFYPDLPKGYQISQYELPLATGGWLEITMDATAGGKNRLEAGVTKRVGITRLHMEEDAAKNLHEGFLDSDRNSYIDYNRCGVPLIEIVSEPDIRSPEEAYAYLTTLKQILEYAGISDCDMEKGSLRCDGNVSVRRMGSEEFGMKVEVKNLNSFRYLVHALEHEIERQISVLESGGKIAQETRLWNVSAGRTEPMRSKEYAHDYRYFPEPDLLPVRVSEEWKEQIRSAMRELPAAKRARFLRDYGITPYDAGVLTATRPLANYFENVVKAGAPGKAAANWMQTELLRRLNDAAKEIGESPVSAESLADLIRRVESGEITATVGKKVFARMFESGKPAAEIISAEGLGGQVGIPEIDRITRELLQKDASNFEKYRFGKEGLFKSFVGQVMKATKGKADPRTVHDRLRLGLERAVAESFVRVHPGALAFVRFGIPPEPDLVYRNKEGNEIGIEVTTTYLNQEEAKVVWQQALTGQPVIWISDTIVGVDQTYFETLLGAILKKKGRAYSMSPTWLVVDFNYPLGSESDVQRIAEEASQRIRQLGNWPFREIWAVWQRTNVATALKIL
jgi:aspartyl-tRNA(Asn)/glutamyl-tRNA(Gln) amidotransferase subunit B